MVRLTHNNPMLAASSHVRSYYAASAAAPVSTEPFDGSIESEVCVIGGGFTGLSCALHLARRGRRVVLLEQSLLGWGASGRNGGQVHVGQRRDPRWLESQFGQTNAQALWKIGLGARDHLDWLMRSYSIDCQFRAGLIHADHREKYVTQTRAHVDYLNSRYGYDSLRCVDAREMRHLVDSADYLAGSLDMRGGHLHPLNLALGIARAAQSNGARLFEGIEATSITRTGSRWQVGTAHGAVSADNVVLACNGYLRGLSSQVQTHVMPINNFIAVTEPLEPQLAECLIRNQHAVSDSRFVVYYFRMTPDHRLLFGGGETYTYRFPKDIAAFVRRHIVRIFPQLASTRIDYAWGGTLAITPTRMPYLRELSPGLYNSSGYSGKGVVMAPYAGKMVADAICGDRDEFQQMSQIPIPPFPGGPALRAPTLIAAMSFYALADTL